MATRHVEHRAPPAGRSLSFLSDEALARRVALGDSAAFEVLFDRYRSPLFRFCRALLRAADDAEEAFQAAMLNAHRALATGPPERLVVRPWLYRIARNACLAALDERPPLDAVLAEEPAAVAAAGAGPDQREDVRRLQTELQDLPEPQRAALLLREMSGLSHDSVAEALGASPSEARRLIHRAREALSAYPIGDDLACAAVCEVISAGDKRTLSARHAATHLRDCGACQGFMAEQDRLRGRMSAFLPPVPALVSERILAHASSVDPASEPLTAEVTFSEWGYCPWTPATRGESCVWPPAGAPAAPEPEGAAVIPIRDRAGTGTAREARRWALVGGVAAAVALSAGALAIAGLTRTAGDPALGEVAREILRPAPAPEPPGPARPPADSLEPTEAPRPEPPPGPRRPVLARAPVPAPGAARQPESPPPPPESAGQEDSAPPAPGSGFESGSSAPPPTTPVTPREPGRDAPRPVERAPAPAVPPPPVAPPSAPADAAGGGAAGGDEEVPSVPPAGEPADPTAGGDPSPPPDQGGEPAGEPVSGPVRDAGPVEVPVASGALGGLPGLVVAALPSIGSRAGSALRDRDAGPVTEGEAQGTGDLGIGGIKIGRPPTALGSAAGLGVPEGTPRTDSVLWSVPGTVFDLLRSPVRGYIQGDRSDIAASRVAALGWRLGAGLPRPPEEDDALVSPVRSRSGR